MPEYRRIYQPGGTYFFTLITYNRKPIFRSKSARDLLHSVWVDVQSRHKFEAIAVCLLPEHIHAIWKFIGWDRFRSHHLTIQHNTLLSENH